MVADGVMYVTDPELGVSALDLRTGRSLWNWTRPLPKDLRTLGFGRVNRGVAVLGRYGVRRHAGCAPVALDARSGAVRWDAEVADYKLGHSHHSGAAGDSTAK